MELIASNSINIPKDIEKNEQPFIKWLQKQIWFAYDNDQDDIKRFWESNFNKKPKVVPRYILPSYVDIVEVLKNTGGLSIVPKHLCEKELKEKLIKAPIESSKVTEQKLYYSYKLKNSNLREISQFMEEMKKS